MNEEEALAFLKTAWGAVTRSPDEPFPALWLWDFIPGRICGVVGSASTTISSVLETCRSEGAVLEAFHETVDRLKRDWSKLLPDARLDLGNYVKARGLVSYFEGVSLDISDDDKLALRIRWDVADMLYEDAKRAALARCREIGLDLDLRRVEFYRRLGEIVGSCQQVLIDLLNQRLELDVAVVLVAVGAGRYKYHARIQKRVFEEWTRLDEAALQALRGAGEDFLNILHDKNPSTRSLATMSHNMEDLWQRFRDEFETLRSNVARVQPSPAAFTRVRELIEGITMTNITITGDGNVIGDNNVVITRISRQLEAATSREIAEAFALLKGEVLQLTAVNEKTKRRAVRAVEDAEDEAADAHAKAPTIEEGLKRAKTILEDAGATFDEGRSWGARLARVGQALVKFLPGAWDWLSTIG